MNGRPCGAAFVLGTFAALASAGVLGAEIHMARVAGFWESFCLTFPCGDGNHNGYPEIYGTSDHHPDSLVIYENQGGNSFRQIETGIRLHQVRDFSYEEGDSLAEIISARTIYRALRRDTFPTESVYTIVSNSGAIFTKFTDFDRDGRREVAFGSNGVNGSGIRLYESRGPDSWVQVPFPLTLAEGQFAYADFDRDSATEIVSGDPNGNLFYFKCMGNDQYALLCSTSLAPDIESYCCSAANDMDGDSLPELINLSLDTRTIMCNVRVYQAAADSLFECVWSTQIPHGDEWYWSVGEGDVDGDGREEFAVTTGYEVRLFKSTGRHQYEQVWQYSPGGGWVRFFDLNSDGRDELIISPESTFVFEDTAGLGGILGGDAAVPVSRPSVISPARNQVRFVDLGPNAEVELFDKSGRFLRRAKPGISSDWTWDLKDEHDQPVPTGTYFAIVRDRESTTQLKFCVVR